MSFSLIDAVSLRTKRRSPLICPRNPDAPVPPTLLGSPHLSSPNSIFVRKSYVPRWPSHAEDEWLRDMVPVDGSALLLYAKSEAGSACSTPSPTASEGPNPFGTAVVPPRTASTRCALSAAAHTPHST